MTKFGVASCCSLITFLAYSVTSDEHSRFRVDRGHDSSHNHGRPGEHFNRNNLAGHSQAILQKELRLQILPANPLHVNEGRKAVLQCRVEGDPSARISWSRVGASMSPSAQDNHDGYLIINQVTNADQGTYICTATTTQSKEAAVELYVDRSNQQPTELVGPRQPIARCEAQEATCRNGECVKRENLCDGEFDCRDRSDELNCGRDLDRAGRPCEPNEFKCDNGMCVQKMWVCDSEDDCGDRSDEKNCGAKKPGDACAPWEYECRSRNQCIPRNFHCDAQNDCQDGSDEIGCVGPTVVEPPQQQISACDGKDIVITCRATGVPLPHISWRLNWGHVCEPPRCTQESHNGFGKLTIRNANNLDQGAYSCEAINVKNRVLAVPDAILTIDGCALTKCHRHGTLNDNQGRCVCKPNVVGPSCDRCEENAFHFPDQYNHGCIRCFCMGITKQCQESKYFRTQERLGFAYDDQAVTLSEINDRPVENVKGDWQKIRGYLTIDSPRSQAPLYWKLPARLGGNKLTAYGGKLRFLFQFEGCSSSVSEPLVVIKGNEITLVHSGPSNLPAGRPNEIVIDMLETSWNREDGQEATREHFLMTLAGLESFLIRFTHCSGQSSSSLGDVVLDIAVPTDTQQVQAKTVEQCFCPQGYQGLSCEECAAGYERSGGGLYLGTCIKKIDTGCHPVGSISPKPGAYGRCVCKEYTQGPQCNECKAHSFYLSVTNPHGCTPCFCSGVTKDCDSSNFFVTQEKLSFDQSHPEELQVRTSDVDNHFTSEHKPLVDGQRHLVVDDFSGAPSGKSSYLKIPGVFLGNKITSYGGAIVATVKCSGSGEDKQPFFIIRGNDISLQFRLKTPVQSDQVTTITANFFENEWFREDGLESTREHLLMTLADLNTILLKVSCFDQTERFSLIDLAMDYAVPQQISSVQATAVEQCTCPQGYMGSSCEDCSSGYTRTGGGLYLGLCERCQCNGHAELCDPEYGDCVDCQHNTHGPRCNLCKPGSFGDATRGRPDDCLSEAEGCRSCQCHNHSPRGCDRDCRCTRCEHNTEGVNCESCKRGFYGDARRGTPHDCQPCPCPECYLDHHRRVVCVPCPTGYTGPTCTDCAEGYSLDPYDRRCKPIDANIGVEPERQEVEQGAAISFRCSSSNAQVRLSWYGPDNNLPPGSYETQGQLVLYNVGPNDAGKYRCVGVFPDGRAATAYGHLSVRPRSEPFRVYIEEPKHAQVEPGRPHTMRCIATGQHREPVQFSWSKVSEQSLPRDAQQSEGTLSFYEIGADDEGHYQCLAHSADGHTAQDDGSISLKSSPTPQPAALRVVVLEPKSVRVENGDTASFKCQAENTRGQRPELTWTRLDHQPLSTEAIVEKGNLNLYHVSNEDAGGYRCTGTLPDTGETAHDDAEIQISTGEPFQVQIDEPKSKLVFENGNANFNCRVISKTAKPYKLEWAKETGEMPDSSRSTAGQLSFSSLRREDAGIYVCTGRIVGTNVQSADRANLTIAEHDGLAPLPVVDPATQIVKVGEPIQITCTSIGSPPPVLQWGFKTEQGALREEADQDDGVLHIPSAQMSDAGEYFCMASNEHRTLFERATVTVDPGSEAPIVKVTPKKKSLKPGEDFVFECVAIAGSPPAQLIWISGDSAILDSNIQQSESGTLTISNAREDNSGKYTCKGSNNVGEHSDTAELTVGKGDLTVRIEPANNGTVDVDVTGPLKLECVAEAGPGLPQPTVEWIRDEGPSRGDLPEGHTPATIEGRFVIHDAVTEINKGIYTCQGRSGNLTKEVSVNVNVLPRRKRDVIIMGASERHVPEGGSLLLRCMLNNDGRPTPSLEWSRLNGAALPTNVRVEEPGSLRIDSFSAEHVGTYECRHVDVNGESLGAASVRVVMGSEHESDELPPLAVSVQGGAVRTLEVNEALVLQCTANAQPGVSSELKWYHQGKSSGERAARGSVENGTLTVNNVKPYDAGIYICVQYLDGKRNGDYQVTVLVSLLASDAVKRRLALGEHAEVECPVYSTTGMQYNWMKVNGDLSERVSPNDQYISISDFNADDAGVYECEAQFNGDVAIGYVELVNRDPNKIQMYMVVEPDYVTPGSDIKFECIVEGDDDAKVTWSRSDGSLPSRAKFDGNTMTINNIRREETGVYTCTANTKAGRLSTTAGLPLGGKVTTNLVRRYFRTRRRYHHVA